MKDAARLLGYFAATILFGALFAPFLYWTAQWLAAHGILPRLAQFDFEAFFHRAVMLGALLFFWPLIWWLRIKNPRDLGLIANRRWMRDAASGFLLSALPVFCCGAVLLSLKFYGMRSTIRWPAVGSVALAAMFVPVIEEALFRGLFLGVLLRASRRLTAIVLSAGIFSIVHFLKAPQEPTSAVGWKSGFISITHAFGQFTDPMLLLAGFTTLFVIGLILADARLSTRSLWLPIGLHSGWVFASGASNKITQREIVALPWLGKNLLIGIVPLGVCFLTWALLKGWFSYGGNRES